MAQPLVMMRAHIAHCQALLAAHGDLPVVLEDADTGWPMVPTLAYAAQAEHVSLAWQKIGPCFTVAGGYDSDHDPLCADGEAQR